MLNGKIIMNLYKKDVEKIPSLSVLMLYRRSLKLIRDFPSANKENMRETLMEEYRENSTLTNQEEIKQKIRDGQGALRYIYSNEVQRRNLNGMDVFDDIEDEQNYVRNFYALQEELEKKQKEVNKQKVDSHERFEEF